MSVPAAYLGVILIWSTTPLAIKWSGEGTGFLLGVTGRMAIGVLLCVALLKVMNIDFPWHSSARRTYFAASIAIYGAMLSVYWGVQYIPSGFIAVLFGLTPIVTGIMSAIWLNERSLTTSKIIGMLLGLAGLVLIFYTGTQLPTNALLGIAAIVISVLLHSGSSVWVKQIGANIPALAITTGGLTLALPMYGLTWFLAGGHIPSGVPMRTGLSIVYLGVFGSVIGFMLYYYTLKHLQVSTIALITLITPVTALLLGHYLNGENIRALVWVGAASISLGLLIHQWGTNLQQWAFRGQRV